MKEETERHREMTESRGGTETNRDIYSDLPPKKTHRDRDQERHTEK